MRKWYIKNQNESNVRRLCGTLNCTHFFARILINRGIEEPAQAQEFINANRGTLLNPFLFRNMQKAVDRIGVAVRNGEKITVYGDYDVDGITATALLVEALKELGAKVDFYIPNRFTDGYGVNVDAIRGIAANGTKLIITVDTGITAVAEVEFAKSLGIDMIITDHHECQEQLPDTVIINPKHTESGYPFVHLAGVGVVFKLVCALDSAYGAGGAIDRYAPFTAIGTVADIMAMKGENRYIVRRGLELLRNTENPGLRALIERCVGDRPIDTSTIGFVLAPRINAAGRMESAALGVELLTTKDAAIADRLVDELCRQNNNRQATETQILEEAVEMIEGDIENKKRNAIVLWSENWHNGVVGIVASRLKERYNKPCILFSISEDYAKGSGRSIKPFNLFDALGDVSEYTEKFGGHAYASGVLVRKENLEQFRDSFCAEVDRFLATDSFEECIEIDCLLTNEDLTVKNIKDLSRLAPFGRENETPIFCMRGVRILDAAPTANGNHMRLSLLCGQVRITAFYFNVSPASFMYRTGETVDIVFEADINSYNGRQSVQLSLKDIRNNKKESKKFLLELNRIGKGDFLAEDLPDRSQIAAVYRYLQSLVGAGGAAIDISALPQRVAEEYGCNVSSGAAYHSIAVLKELGVLEYDLKDIYLENLKIHSENRVNLEDSEILRNIKGKVGEMACV